MDKTIAASMWQHINAWPDKPVKSIQLDNLPKDPPGMMIQQQPGTIVEKRFMHGGFIGRWPFALVVSTRVDETGDRLDAVAVLNAASEWLSETPLPELGPRRKAQALYMHTVPAVTAAYNDGREDYMAMYSLQYKEDPTNA